jgi:cobalt/nickel transport system permease protein
MHIADGYLSLPVCAGTAALSAAALGYSLRALPARLGTKGVPLTGMVAALVFAGQMVNFPIGLPVSGHLLGGVLAAALLGPQGGCVALALVLLVQMALFSDGGWLAYGANLFNMGVIGAMGGYAVFAAISRRWQTPRGIVMAGMIAAWVSVVAASTAFSMEFALSHPRGEFDLPLVFALMAGLHSLIGVGEALITGMVLRVVVMQRPDLVSPDRSSGGVLAETRRFCAAGMVAALAIAAFLSPLASEYADGLEEVARRAGFEGRASTTTLVFSDYQVEVPLVWSAGQWPALSASVAGILGTTAVLLLGLIVSRSLASGGPAPKAEHAG